MLGLIHKVTLKQAHPDLLRLLPPSSTPPHHYATRLASKRHNKQIHEHCDGQQTDLTQRSLFGLVNVYNLLPQNVVDAPTTTTFQTLLTHAARVQCQIQAPHWDLTFSLRNPRHVNFYNLLATTSFHRHQHDAHTTTTPSTTHDFELAHLYFALG